MSLRRKTFAIVGLSLIVLLLGLLLIMWQVLEGGYRAHEQEHMRENMQRARAVIDNELATMDVLADDWAYWDNPYTATRFNLVIFVDASGQPIYSQAYDTETASTAPLPAGVMALVGPDSPLTGDAAGIFLLDDGPMLVAVSRSLLADASSPNAITLVVGRWLDEAELARLSDLAYLDLALYRYDPTASASPVPAQLYSRYADDTLPPFEQIVVVPQAADHITGFMVLEDVGGSPALVLAATMHRTIYRQMRQTMLLFAGAFALFGLVAVGVVLAMVGQVILRRVLRLSDEVAAIGDRSDPATRVNASGQDELGALARDINAMLAALQESQQATRASEALYESLVANLPVSVFRKDLEGRYTFANERYCQLSQRPLDAIIGHTDAEQFPPEQAQHYRQSDQYVIDNDTLYDDIESWRFTPDDSLHYVRVIKSPVYDAAGQITGVQGAIWDITATKQAEAALRANEIRYRTLFDSAPYAIFMMQGERFIDCNSYAEEMYGCARDQIVGQTPFRFSTPQQYDGQNSQTSALAHINAALAGEPQRFDWRHTRLDGTPFDAEVSLNRLEIEGEVFVQAIVRDVTQRKRALDALRENETRFRTLFNNAPYAIFILEGDRIIDCNPEAPRIFGCAREQFVGQTPQFFSPPTQYDGRDSTEKAREKINGALAGEPQRFEWLHARLDGTLFDTEVTLNRLELDGQELVQAILFDITESKATRAALALSEQTALAFQERLKALHAISIALAQADTLDDLYRQAVQWGRDRLGFDRLGLFLLMEGNVMQGTYGISAQGEVVDITTLRRPVRDDRHFQQALTSEQQLVIWRDIELTDMDQPAGHGWNMMAIITAQDRVLGWLSIDNLIRQEPLAPYEPELLLLYAATLGHLITRLRIESARRESEIKYRSLFDVSSDAIFLGDMEGNLLDCNAAASTMFGYGKAELLGMNVTDLLLPEAVPGFAQVLATMKAEGYLLFEIEGVRQDGTTFPFETVTQRVLINGEPHVLAYTRDISARKQAERQRLALTLERERVRLLADFIRDLSHEFRTPLSTMNSNLYMLRRAQDPDRRARQLDVLGQQITFIHQLIEAMLTMSRLDSADHMTLAPQHIGSTLQGLKTALAAQVSAHDLTLTLELADDLPLVLGSGPDLHEALRQLLDNAIHYTPAGGQITLRAYASGQAVVIDVQDTGMGISPEDQTRIFDRFYRADEARTARRAGLGLSIARKIIELHGGSVSVASEEGVGSTFRVTLPGDSP